VRRIAQTPRTSSQAIALTAVVTMCMALVNWGLGLILGALLARDMALSARQRGIRVHYPLLAAAGYTGLLVWHSGLSGSAPLTMTTASTAKGVLPEQTAFETIPLSDTLFSPMNLCVTVAIMVLVPLILVKMQPKGEACEEVVPDEFPEETPPTWEKPTSPAAWLNQSRFLGWLLAAVTFIYIGIYVKEVGLNRVNLNVVNLLFLGLGLLIYGRPKAYADAIANATRGCSGIILQFPIYAGIMAVMVHSGLVAEISAAINAIATPDTYGPLTFLSAGGVNVFVPSGGGQFAVQGPIIFQTLADIQQTTGVTVPAGKAIMAFAYGDQWTNMLQPFWALPLLAITKLKASRIIGYTAATMFLVLPVYLIALMVF